MVAMIDKMKGTIEFSIWACQSGLPVMMLLNRGHCHCQPAGHSTPSPVLNQSTSWSWASKNHAAPVLDLFMNG